ncbi:MAG: prolyl oligopeptidase family serine peptidase [Lachnospiraceae bacterium]|nr:prolyl oligopeptidase family serine peptidase [Lachnospiraceae bacterium]
MGMLLPPNWDKAGADNERLCARFEKRSYSKNGRTLFYRIFKPGLGGRGLLPLVIYLHGADAAGDDNELQLNMHDIGTFLARDDMSARFPACVLAPQYGPMMHWGMPEVRDLLWELIANTLDNDPGLDRTRVYIYGYSAGGVGTFRLIKEHPDFFAAALTICGATGSWGIDNLTKIPLYMVHAADDNIVRSTYRTGRSDNPGNLGSADIYERFKNASRDIHYREYPAGFMESRYNVNPHCSWVAVSDTRSLDLWEWLFSKRRKEEDPGDKDEG